MLGIVKKGKLQQAFQLYANVVGGCIVPDIVTYNALISGLCNEGHMQEGLQLLDEMMEQGIDLQGNNLWTLRIGNNKNALALYVNMVEKGLLPDVITYTILMNFYCKTSHLQYALGLLREMGERGILLDVVSYTTLNDGYCKASCLHDALKLFNEMIERGITPDVVTYTVLISAHCNIGNMKTVVMLHHEMVEKGIAFDYVIYSTLLNDGFIKTCKLYEVSKLCWEMENWSLV